MLTLRHAAINSVKTITMVIWNLLKDATQNPAMCIKQEAQSFCLAQIAPGPHQCSNAVRLEVQDNMTHAHGNTSIKIPFFCSWVFMDTFKCRDDFKVSSGFGDRIQKEIRCDWEPVHEGDDTVIIPNDPDNSGCNEPVTILLWQNVISFKWFKDLKKDIWQGSNPQ
ncbi:hypothetical protein BDR04DRAFT_1122522 [Suillus decipiens]|nr:hypothetical protein BDR04DRAFT_1122522 [Suillus decipiens]